MNAESATARLQSLNAEELLTSAQRVLPGLLSLLLALGIGWQLSKLLWALIPAQQSALADLPPLANRGAPLARAAASINVKPIADAHLFGTADTSAPVIIDQPAEDAPDTQLNLTLKGTLAALEQDGSLAIIADGGGNEQVYAVADDIPGGATLHAVRLDHVILRRAGILESLKLPDDFPNSAPVARSRRTALNRAARTTAPTVQQAVSNNAGLLRQVINPRPHFINGKLKGYKLYPGRDREQFYKLGLKAGDLVTAINGTTLDNPAQGLTAFQELGDASQVTVTVERNGSPQTLNINAGQIDFKK